MWCYTYGVLVSDRLATGPRIGATEKRRLYFLAMPRVQGEGLPPGRRPRLPF